MAGQTNVLNRERITAIALESVYGSYVSGVITIPSGPWPYTATADVYLYDDIGTEGLSEAREDVTTESVRRVDPKVPYHGLRIGTTIGSISKYCQAVKGDGSSRSSQMDSFWVRPTGSGNAGAMSTCLLIGASLGAGTYFSDQTLSPPTFDQPGSVAVHAGSTTTAVVVTTATGTQFTGGTWIKVQKGSGATFGYDFAKVISVATDTLTVYPALSGVPVDGAVVANMYNYFPAEVHATAPGMAFPNASILFARAWAGDATDQIIISGAYGDVAFEFTQGDKAVMFKFSAKATDFSGPANLSLPAQTVPDSMGAVTRFAPQIYLQSSDSTGAGSSSFPSTITRGTTLVCPKFTIEIKGSYEQIRDLNAPQTVAGVEDSSGRPRFGKVMVQTRFDQQAFVDFGKNPDVLYNLTIIQPIGSGITQSAWIWEIPCATQVAEPKVSKVGEYQYVDMELNPLPDGTQALQGTYATHTMPVPVGSPSAGQLDAATAAFRVAFG